jgi:hypothetical protein
MGKSNHLRPIHTGGTTSITTRRTPAENTWPATRTADGRGTGILMAANLELTDRTPAFFRGRYMRGGRVRYPVSHCIQLATVQDSLALARATAEGGRRRCGSAGKAGDQAGQHMTNTGLKPWLPGKRPCTTAGELGSAR